MKQQFFITAIIALVISISCSNAARQSNTPFRLEGQITNPADDRTVLLYEGETLVDSTMLDENNTFIFERTVDEPTLFTLLIGFQPYGLLLQNGDDITFSADLAYSDRYEVIGSEINIKLQELQVIQAKLEEEQNNIMNEFQTRVSAGESEHTVREELIGASQLSLDTRAREVYVFSDQNRDNLAGLYGMLYLFGIDPTGYETELFTYAEEAGKRFPDNTTVQFFAKHMSGIKRLAIGQEAPDFSSTTPDGNTVSLSDFRGQYVLVDFWAAWCTPCRVENPNIVAQYHAFKDKGFTVLGVSLDRSRDAWLAAIADDKLTWTQVSDLKMWENEVAALYNITAIPASFMVDPAGKLVAKNLRGPELRRFLSETLP